MCNGDNGAIVIVTSGGTGSLQYSIDGGASFGASPTFSTGDGSYSIVVEDANGCQSTGNATINEPQGISFNTTSTNANCGVSDGSLTINGSGGTGTLVYSIDGGANFQAANTFTGLSSGTYSIVVQDDNGCQENGLAIFWNRRKFNL